MRGRDAWGACRSRLIDVLRSGHRGVKLPREAFDRIVTWIDLNASYYGTYACNFPNNPYGRCPLTFAQIDRLARGPRAKPFAPTGAQEAADLIARLLGRA